MCCGFMADFSELLGDLVYIELPAIGKTIKAHDNIGVVESVKAASDLYSPVSGEVIAINDAVVSTADVIADNGVIHIIDTVLMPA